MTACLRVFRRVILFVNMHTHIMILCINSACRSSICKTRRVFHLPYYYKRTHTYALKSKARACLLVLLYVYYKGYYISPLHICSDVRTLFRRILHISVQQTCVFKIYLHLYWVTRCMLRAGVLCNTTIYLFTRYAIRVVCVVEDYSILVYLLYCTI